MAGVTKFDKPIDAQFINTYVPIPFEQMMQAGAMKQQRYDQSAAAMDASIARAEQINAAPNTQDARDRDAALNKIYAIRDKYSGKDLSDSMVIRQLNNEIRSAVKPSDIKKWEGTYAGWEQYQKNKALMTSRGQQVYDDFDFTDYDSSVSGVFSGMPTMDLGASVESKIDEFMTKPQQEWREVLLSDGAKGIEHFRDVNKIYSRIANNISELTDDPAIQQFMEKQGMDIKAFQQFLIPKAVDYEEKRMGGIRSATTSDTTPSGPIPGDFYSEIKGEGEVLNVDKGKKIVRENRQLHEELDEKQKTLLRLQDKGGDPAKIEALENDIALFEENLGVHDFKLQEARKRADLQHEDAVTAIHDDALEQLTDLGVGQKEAEVLLDKASIYFDKATPRASISRDPELNFKDPDKRNRFLEGGFKKFDALVNYVQANKKSVRDLDDTFHDALKEEFSRTETVNEISLHQTAVQNGIRRFVGGDNKMIPSLIDPAVTTQIQEFPEKYVMSSDREKLNEKTNKLRKYIKNSATDESLYSFELRTIDKIINEDGSLNLNYKLKGPDVGGDFNETMINVKVDEPTQINNIIKQLYLQSGEQGIIELVGAMEFKNQMGAGTAAGEYNMVSGISVTVKQEEGVLKIYLPNSNESVAVANNRRDLPYVLAELNVNILRRIATEE